MNSKVFWREMMSDECTCEKCQAGSVYARGTVEWSVGRLEIPADGQGLFTRDQYLVISEGGIALRQQILDR
jgi:hypothetical protein